MKCYVKLFLAFFLWLISANSHAVEITAQRVLATNLQQPVGVAVSAEKPIFLDAQGLHFESAVVETESVALSIFAYKNEIWSANPTKRDFHVLIIRANSPKKLMFHKRLTAKIRLNL
ncbi:hypothetical protein LBMAG43_13540 [Methylococcaceae bacterium]|nr:hypothetical protein LBMAG43_13540 [Methylococcaceae bacterium]